jgi:hypothetical protein
MSSSLPQCCHEGASTDGWVEKQDNETISTCSKVARIEVWDLPVVGLVVIAHSGTEHVDEIFVSGSAISNHFGHHFQVIHND